MRQLLLAICATLSFGIAADPVIAQSVSPREQLQQMVEQLQKTPTDNELRKSIFKVAAGLTSLPALPDEALRHEGRGNAAFKNAKDGEGFIAAAREFEAASLIAPWVAGYYADMCTAYEKGGALLEAAHSCWLYSLAVTDEKEVRAAKLRAAEVEYEMQKYSAAELQKLNNTKKPFSAIAGLPSGEHYFCSNNRYQSGEDIFRLGPAGLAPYGRQEFWVVRNGSTASVVVVFWVSSESFSELMKAGIVIKNPLIKEFLGKFEPNIITSHGKSAAYSTNSTEAALIQILEKTDLEPAAAGLHRSTGLGRWTLSAYCELIE